MNAMCLRGIRGRPTLPLRDLRRQNSRKPFRCQRITVSGLTITSADCHSSQSLDSPTQKTRSEGRSRALRGAAIRCQLLAESEVLEQKSLLRDEERPNRSPDDGKQERHPPKLAEGENVNDFKRDGVFADYGGRSL